MINYKAERIFDIVFGALSGLIIGVAMAFIAYLMFLAYLQEEGYVPLQASTELIQQKQDKADLEAKNIALEYEQMPDSEIMRGDAEAYR